MIGGDLAVPIMLNKCEAYNSTHGASNNAQM